MKNNRFPMTDAQQGIWLSQQQLDDRALYGVAEKIILRGKLATAAWIQAADTVLASIPALGMRLEDSNSDFPDLVTAQPLSSQYVDLRGEDHPQQACDNLIVEAISQPIDCYTSLTSHAILYQLEAEKYCWFLRAHHLVCDGFAFSLIARELAKTYEAVLEGQEPSLRREEKIEQYLQAQKDSATADMSAGKRYWQSQTPREDVLPLAPVRESYRSVRQPAGVYTEPLSPAHLVLAVSLLEQAINRKDEAVVGVHMMARHTTALLDTVCTSQNQLPLLVNLHAQSTVDQALKEISQRWRQMSAHQNYRQEQIRRDRQVAADQHLIDCALNIVPFGKPLVFGQAQGQAEPVWDGPADLLTVDVRPSASRGHEVALVVPEKSCAPEVLHAYASTFERLYRSLLCHRTEEDRRLLSELPLSEEPTCLQPEPPEETLSYLTRWGDLIGQPEQGLIAPDQTRRGADIKHTVLALARLLADISRPQKRVLILLPRNSWAILAPLASLYSGYTFIPCDINWPAERVRTIVELSQPDTVLTTQKYAHEYQQKAAFPGVSRLISLDAEETLQLLAAYAQERPRPAALLQPEDTAYILFTSGTTGLPKGVRVRYRNFENYIRTVAEEYLPRAQRAAGRDHLRFIHEYSFAFDSALSPLAYFMLGNTLCLPEDETLKNPHAHVRYLNEQAIDGIDTSPAMLQELIYAGLDIDGEEHRITTIFIGGDKCSPTLWSYLYERPALNAINAYGPTENTVEATYAVIAEHEEPTIGSSLPRQFSLVTTSWGQICPAHIPGELWLGGASVAADYLNLPEETAAKFTTGRYGRVYRTGDLVSDDGSGNYTFWGRIDQQLSLNGMRIETEEIEQALLTQPEIVQVALAVHNDGGGDRLVGYIVTDPKSSEGFSHTTLRQRLRDYLPAAHIPAVFIPLETIPLTERGKIDYRALPAPYKTTGAGRPFNRLTSEEEAVARIYAEITSLTPDSISSETDFFSIGGHSLGAMRVVSRLHELGYTGLAVKDIFTDPRVSAVADICIAQGTRERAEDSGQPHTPDTEITSAQRRIWFIESTGGPSKLYTIPLVFDFEGKEIDTELCKQALIDIIAHYPSLSSLYLSDSRGNLLLQRLTASEVADRFVLQTTEFYDSAHEHVNLLPIVIDISRELPLKAFVSTNGSKSRIILIFHHVAADGWALSAFTRAFSLAYQARAHGSVLKNIPPYSLPVSAAVTDEDLIWWQEYARALPAPLNLPADRPRPQEREHLGEEVRVQLPGSLTHQLHQVAKAHGATEFMVLQALVAMLLSRCGAGEDIALGTVMSARTSQLEEAAVTFAANTVLTRTDTSGNPSLGELLDSMKKRAGELMEHSHVPFDTVVNAVNPVRSASHHPLFQVLIIGQNIEQAACQLGEGQIAVPYTVGTDTAKFDMTFEFSTIQTAEEHTALELRLEYATDIFDRETAEDISHWFMTFAQTMTAEPQLRLWDRPLDPRAVTSARTEAQRMLEYRHLQKQLETEKMEAAQYFADGRSMTEQIEQILRLYSEHIAVVDTSADGGRQEITYAQLDEMSRRVRDHLIHRGLGVGDRVALLIPRSVHQVVAVLGALRAGVTYVPLDPEYPLARLNMILGDSGVEAVLYRDSQTLFTVDKKYLEDTLLLDLAELQPVETEVRVPSVAAETAAYIIFTSGSTGRPKGVVVSQSNVMRLLASTDAWFSFTASDTWTLFHSYAFDFAVWEMFGALLTGGKLVIVPHTVSRSPREFGSLLTAEQVTVLNQTPSAFGQLVIADETESFAPLALRTVILGGEAMDLAMVHRWQKNHPSSSCRVINMYGITETTVHVTYQEVTENSRGISPVGEPIPDLAVYLLDAGGHPVPDGVVGEIYVGGAGVAREYLGRKELTAQRFIPDPFAAHARENSTELKDSFTVESLRMYKSGDLALRQRSGVLDFRGRIDRQVQIRGFRIELGELESAALTYPGIQDSFAHPVGQSDSDKRLILYVVSSDHMRLDPIGLRKYLSGILPQYMVPATVMAVEKFPLTVNGKLDTAALPAPFIKNSGGRRPETAREQQLYRCFVEVLGIESCSVEDSFFDLGGHSMLAVELVAAIETHTGCKVRVGTIMGAPSIELLAQLLDGDTSTDESDLEVMMPLQRADGGEHGAIYCIHPAGGLSWCYASMTTYVPPEIPVWGLQARGVLHPAQQPSSLAEMAGDYLREILKVHRGGPIHLVGWSLGGMVAQVIAHKAVCQGLELGAVALLDAYPSEAEQGVGEPPLADAVSSVLAMAGLEDDVLEGDFSVGALQRAFANYSSPMAGLSPETVEALTVTYRNTAKILREYEHPLLEADMLFFSALRAGVGREHDPQEWRDYVAGQLLVKGIDCTHREMTQAAPMSVIAPVIVNHIFSQTTD